MVLGPRDRAAAIQNRIRVRGDQAQTSSAAAAASPGGTAGASSAKTKPISTYHNFHANDIKDLYNNLSLTNLYEVHFSSMKPELERFLAAARGINKSWWAKTAGLLCTETSLPSSSFATAETKSDFMGVTQEFAHTRLYNDIDLTFYLDADYNVLLFFEGWMDFISSGSANIPTNPNDEEINFNTDPGNFKSYYRRFQYPDNYKMSSMFINKFDKSNLNWDNPNAVLSSNNYVLHYQFINVFPKSITSIPISYGASEVLKVTITFNYDRYHVTRSTQRPIPSLFQRRSAGSSSSRTSQPPAQSTPSPKEQMSVEELQSAAFRDTVGDRKFKSPAARKIQSKY